MPKENKLEKKTRFDGKFTHKNADQYIERCKAGAINLHLYRIGNYSGCVGCEHQKDCSNSAYTAGEQAEF